MWNDEMIATLLTVDLRHDKAADETSKHVVRTGKHLTQSLACR